MKTMTEIQNEIFKTEDEMIADGWVYVISMWKNDSINKDNGENVKQIISDLEAACYTVCGTESVLGRNQYTIWKQR